MKQVKFAKTFRDRRNETTVEEYPAGWSGEISDEQAQRAVKAGVLASDPVDVTEKPDAKVATPPRAKA